MKYLFASLLLVCGCGEVVKEKPPEPPPLLLFVGAEQILDQNCRSCHNPGSKVKTELKVDDWNKVTPEVKKKIVARITTDDKAIRMPKDREPLSEQDKDIIKEWAK